MALWKQHEGPMARATGAFIDAVDDRFTPRQRDLFRLRAAELRAAAVALRPHLHAAARAWRAAEEGR